MSKLIRTDEIQIRQPHFGMGLYVSVIIGMMTIQWITLDMYLPALPVLKEEFGVSEALLNISLNSDLICCAIGNLIGGTLSDKYGRKPVLLLGLFVASLSCFCAATSQGVILLTIMRGLCGLGGGFALTIATAMFRDSFTGATFQRVTTFSQAAAIIGPVFAPALGAFFIEYLSWRWIFLFLGIATLITTVPLCFTKETWPQEKRQVDSIWQATKQTFHVAARPDFLLFLSVMMILTMPLWAYLGVCSYIYYDFFGVTNLQYSILYACGTIAAFGGPFLYLFLSRHKTNRWIIHALLGTLGASVLLLLLIGPRSAVLFLIAVLPIEVAEAMVRPMSMVIILEQHKEEAGSASAVTGFALMAIGVVATALATLGWGSFLMGLTIITLGSLLLATLLWIIILRKKMYAKPLDMHGRHR